MNQCATQEGAADTTDVADGLRISSIMETARRQLKREESKAATAKKKLDGAIASKSSRSQILEAIASLHESDVAISRQRLQTITGLTQHVVDDHLNTLVNEGVLRRLVAGVFAPVVTYRESRSISHTLLPDGTSKLELGELCIDLTPKERRMLGSMLMGDAAFLSNLQTTHDFNVLASELTTCMLLLRRTTAFQEQIGEQLGVTVDPATKGLGDRLAVLADRLIEGSYRS